MEIRVLAGYAQASKRPDEVGSPAALCCPERGAPNRDWYLDVSCLDQVTSLRIYEDHEAKSRPYLGIIVQYKDGHRDALGEIRLDEFLSSELGQK
jgi:hypothetical protein